MQIRLACGKARVKSLNPFSSRFASSIPLSVPRPSYGVTLSPTRPSSHAASTPVPTSHQLPSHICKTCHYYNNITPMNLPLNMRSAIVDCIANYLPGGVIRTGLDRSRFCHAPFPPPSFFLRVIGDHRWSSLSFFFHIRFADIRRNSFPVEIAWNARNETARRPTRMRFRFFFFIFIFSSLFFFFFFASTKRYRNFRDTIRHRCD